MISNSSFVIFYEICSNDNVINSLVAKAIDTINRSIFLVNTISREDEDVINRNLSNSILDNVNFTNLTKLYEVIVTLQVAALAKLNRIVENKVNQRDSNFLITLDNEEVKRIDINERYFKLNLLSNSSNLTSSLAVDDVNLSILKDRVVFKGREKLVMESSEEKEVDFIKGNFLIISFKVNNFVEINSEYFFSTFINEVNRIFEITLLSGINCFLATDVFQDIEYLYKPESNLVVRLNKDLQILDVTKNDKKIKYNKKSKLLSKFKNVDIINLDNNVVTKNMKKRLTSCKYINIEEIVGIFKHSLILE